jgi:bifunctional DNA-binding transcriptional regulator/antitoxin component of YhaV-PrlF toxin-antitoxin module
MSAAEATPQEIYDVIKGVVEDNYYIYKKQASDAYELLALLNGNGEGHISSVISRGNKIHQEIEDILVGIHDDCRIPCDMEALKYTDEELDAMCAAAEVEQDMKNISEFLEKDKVKKWILPVEEDGDDCVITFPDDLLEAANLKEGDQIEWIDNGDGSCILKKVKDPSWVKGNELAKVKTYQEMVNDGWSMTDDGFWIKENCL